MTPITTNATPASMVTTAFRALGHTVVTATGVGEASTVMGSQHFDVAVVDIGLPDGSGLDWCRAEGIAVQPFTDFRDVAEWTRGFVATAAAAATAATAATAAAGGAS